MFRLHFDCFSIQAQNWLSAVKHYTHLVKKELWHDFVQLVCAHVATRHVEFLVWHRQCSGIEHEALWRLNDVDGRIVCDRRLWTRGCCCRSSKVGNSSGKALCGEVAVFIIDLLLNVWLILFLGSHSNAFFHICLTEVGVVHGEVLFCAAFMLCSAQLGFLPWLKYNPACWSNITHLSVEVIACQWILVAYLGMDWRAGWLNAVSKGCPQEAVFRWGIPVPALRVCSGKWLIIIFSVKAQEILFFFSSLFELITIRGGITRVACTEVCLWNIWFTTTGPSRIIILCSQAIVRFQMIFTQEPVSVWGSVLFIRVFYVQLNKLNPQVITV